MEEREEKKLECPFYSNGKCVIRPGHPNTCRGYCNKCCFYNCGVGYNSICSRVFDMDWTEKMIYYNFLHKKRKEKERRKDN